MRIMHIITRMIIGGAQENTLWNCVDLIRGFGDDVVLVTGPSDGPEGELLRAEGEGKLRVLIEPSMARAIHPWRDWRCYRALRRHIRDFAPDVVHTHSAKGGFLGRLAAWREQVPAVVHTVHGAPFHPYQSAIARRLFQSCERFAARRCHALISVADAMTRLMVEARVTTAERFTTIYSGMDTEPFLMANRSREEARRAWGFGDDDIVVGKVARLFRLKGHADLIAAAAGVVRAQPRVKFLLVGDGTLREELEREVRDRGLESHVKFTGLVRPEEVPYMMSAMDMLVHTSLREGLARTLPQALLVGIPVISYDIDGAREVCIDGTTGRLIAPRDTKGLEEAILDLASSEARRKAFGEAGQELCRETFRHEHMTREIRSLYQWVLGRSNKT